MPAVSLCVGAHGWVARICYSWKRQTVSIETLAANSEGSQISQAPNLHFNCMQLLTCANIYLDVRVNFLLYQERQQNQIPEEWCLLILE